MGRMTKVTAAAASALLVLGVAACGDDDDEPEATTETTDASTEDTDAPGGDEAAFCDGIVEFNGAVNSVDLGDESTEDDVKAAGAELAELWAPIAENAPDEVADPVSEIAGVLEQMEAGDAEAFDAESTFDTYTEVVDEAVGSCGYESVAVTAVDYAFEDVPDTIPAGTVAFDLTNASEAEEHEMIVARKADGVALSWTEILDLPEEESEEMVEFTTAAFAAPGESGSALGTLEPGDYIMVCFIPVGGAEDGPPHFSQGMSAEFTVS